MTLPDPAPDPVVDLVRSFARAGGVDVAGGLPLAELWRAIRHGGQDSPGLAFSGWVSSAMSPGVMFPVLANSADLGAAIGELGRLHPLFGSEQVTVRRSGSGVTVTIEAPLGGPSHPDTVDACVAILCGLARSLTREPVRASRLVLRRPAPPDPARYRELADVVVFDARRDECAFGGADARRPVVGADPVVLRLVRPYADRRLAERGRSWETAVAATLRAQRPGGRSGAPSAPSAGAPALAAVARSLAVSPRALQLRLQAEGTTFSAVQEAARRDQALALVAAADVPLTTIAVRAGFSTPGAFSRAVRRWTGMSPSQYRMSQRAGS